jgi:hypothetical protein
LYLFFRFNNSLTKKEKTALTVVFLSFLFVGYLYTLYQNYTKNRDYEILTAFSQGRDIVCNDKIVNQREFNFISGTLVFSAKKSIKELKGTIYPIKECRIDR